MPYIPPNIVAKAREMDLLTYLQNYEPQELVHFGGNTYEQLALQAVFLFQPVARILPWGRTWGCHLSASIVVWGQTTALSGASP